MLHLKLYGMFDKHFYAHGKTVQGKQPASGARREKMNLLYSIKDSITQCGIKKSIWGFDYLSNAERIDVCYNLFMNQ